MYGKSTTFFLEKNKSVERNKAQLRVTCEHDATIF